MPYMKSLKIGQGKGKQTLICAHWKSFPPPGAGEDYEVLRQNKSITSAQYQTVQIWERECGLLVMAESKCPTCPHRRLVVIKNPVPILRAPDGTEAPVVDSALFETSPRHRHMAAIFRRPGTRGSTKQAAWTRGNGTEGDG